MPTPPEAIAMEATIVRKLRLHILPFMLLLFVIAFIDRINIGFAALTMNRELAISSQQFGFVAGIFFFGYFIFEIPSNLLLHKIGARIWIARILISWGLIAALTGFARSAPHLYIARFLLGVAEAGYFPGVLLYLTYWFRRRQLAHAFAWFVTANPIASVIGAPLSGLILDHAHWLNLSSWRWLLILEGTPAIAGGILTYFLLPDRPSDAGFLSAKEKTWITQELAKEEQEKSGRGEITTAEALRMGRLWQLTIPYFFAMLGVYAMVFWMPQLLKALSSQYSNTRVGVLVMIPYLVSVPAMIRVARSSDHTLERRYHAAVPAMVAAISWAALALRSDYSPFATVVLWSLVASGTYSLLGPFWALPAEFLTGASAAVGIALINSVGNLGGFAGPYALGVINRNTGSFHAGFVLAGASLFMAAVLILATGKGGERKTVTDQIPSSARPAVAPETD